MLLHQDTTDTTWLDVLLDVPVTLQLLLLLSTTQIGMHSVSVRMNGYMPSARWCDTEWDNGIPDKWILLEHTHNHFTALEFVRDNPGEPVPEETFTHSHLSWSSIISICFLHLQRSMASSVDFIGTSLINYCSCMREST